MTTNERASENEEAEARRDDAAAREREVIAFVQGRSALCPKCGYELRDMTRATCPECGEELELRVGSARPKFGWLVLAMAPGCFSGVAAVMVTVPVVMTLREYIPGGKPHLPFPMLGAWVFGIISAASLWLMYQSRHRIMAMTTRRQVMLAGGVWAIHVLAFVVTVAAAALWM